eukprot:4464945-Pleurochrysis_carterae.AAC.4
MLIFSGLLRPASGSLVCQVWNELWGMSFPHEYMALYEASATAVKRVHPSLRVGGPATAGASCLPPPTLLRSLSFERLLKKTHAFPALAD